MYVQSLHTTVLLCLLMLASPLTAKDFWSKYESKQSPTERLDYINEKGGLIFYNAPEDLLRLADSAEYLGQVLSRPDGRALALNYRALFAGNAGHRDSAALVLQQSIAHLRSHADYRELLAQTYNLISIQYFYLKEYQQHLQYSDSALVLAREQELMAMENTILFNRAHIMSELGFPMVTDSLLRTLLHHPFTMGNPGLRSSVCISMSINQLILEQPDSSMYYAEQALKEGTAAGELRKLGTAYFQMARAQKELGNPEMALLQLAKADSIHSALDYKDKLQQIRLLELSLLLDVDSLTRAKQLFDAFTLEHDTSELVNPTETYKLAADLFTALNDPKQAFEMLQRYTRYQVEDSENKLRQRTAELEVKHHLNEKKRAMVALQREKELVEQRQTVTYILAVLAILILLSWLLILRTNHKNRLLKKEREVMLQTEKTAQKERQLATRALYISEKNELLKELLEIANSAAPNKLEALQKNIRRRINHSFTTEQELQSFQQTFEEVNPDFTNRLKDEFASLSETELRLLAFVKMGLNIKEIASLTHVESNSVKTARYRLKRKLNLDKEESLEQFVKNY